MFIRQGETSDNRDAQNLRKVVWWFWVKASNHNGVMVHGVPPAKQDSGKSWTECWVPRAELASSTIKESGERHTQWITEGNTVVNCIILSTDLKCLKMSSLGQEEVRGGWEWVDVRLDKNQDPGRVKGVLGKCLPYRGHRGVTPHPRVALPGLQRCSKTRKA